MPSRVYETSLWKSWEDTQGSYNAACDLVTGWRSTTELRVSVHAGVPTREASKGRRGVSSHRFL